VDARWTDEIHEEWIRNLATNHPNIPIERLEIARLLMNTLLPTATVNGYQEQIPPCTFLIPMIATWSPPGPRSVPP